MPRFDGTGPRGAGMFTGRGEGYCALRLPEPGSGEPAIGHAGIEGRPVRLATDVGRPLASAGADIHARSTDGLSGQARRCRFGKRRCESR
jgi:Family of unknown function (DUF5320)